MDVATLGFGATFASLATREGLIALDKRFLAQVAAQDPALHESLLAARAAPDSLEAKAESHLLTSLGPILDAFVAELFGIQDALDEVVAGTKHLDPVHACKRLFVQRQAVKKYADPSSFDGAALRAELEQMMGEKLTEVSFATHVEAWERNDRKEWLDTAMRYAAWATLTADGRAFHEGGTLFRVPQKIDFQKLVPLTTIERNGVTMLCLPEHHWRSRDGFALTDHGMNGQQALDQINYCIWCHNQGKDFLQARAQGPQDGRIPEVAFRRNPRRLPARGKDQRNAHPACAGARARSIRHHRGRQSDGGGHRPPHLQRLHESLHLPEAGTGRHSSG